MMSRRRVDGGLGSGGPSIDSEVFEQETIPSSSLFMESVIRQVDEESVTALINSQRTALIRFEKTNEMLSNCCLLSATRLEQARKDFIAHMTVIREMKMDLDSIFTRIRRFKQIAEKRVAEQQQGT